MSRKPGSYIACILFALTIFVILVALATMVIANPKLRADMAVFTIVFTLGCVFVVTKLFARVLAAERLSTRDPDANSRVALRMCPDTHILGEDDRCKVDPRTTLTITSNTDEAYTKPIHHTCVSQSMSAGLKTQWSLRELKRECSEPSKDYLSHPYTALSPYCASS